LASKPGTTTLVINAKTHNTGGVTVLPGRTRFSSTRATTATIWAAAERIRINPNLGTGALLGVVGGTSVLIETIP
jgi:hypothetical protein